MVGCVLRRRIRWLAASRRVTSRVEVGLLDGCGCGCGGPSLKESGISASSNWEEKTTGTAGLRKERASS